MSTSPIEVSILFNIGPLYHATTLLCIMWKVNINLNIVEECAAAQVVIDIDRKVL